MAMPQRPVMLSEVSFSAPSTNTSFPAHDGRDISLPRENLSYSSGPDFEEVEMTDNEIAAPYGAPSPQYRRETSSARCESPTPRRMELSEQRRMLHQSAVSSQRHKTPAADLPPKDFGRSPSPEPFRNYESMDESATATTLTEDLASNTSVTTSAPSTSRSDRIRHMTARIEYLHSHHAPSQSPTTLTQYTVRGGSSGERMTSLHREEVDSSREEAQFGPHRRPRSPPAPAAPISRKSSEPRSVPRAARPSLLTNEGEACLREIDESLDELRDLLPTAHAALDTSSTSTTNSRRRVMRISELCTKLDGLAAIAYEMRAVAESQRLKYAGRSGETNKRLARELDHFLEQISRKADSMAYLLEQLGSGGGGGVSRPTTGDSAAVSASTADSIEPVTAPMPRALAAQEEQEETASSFTATSTSSSTGRKYRQLLSKKHASSVMDTIEMMADTVLRLADRLDNQNEALMATMEHQQDQKDDVELCKAVLHEICINGGQPEEYTPAAEADEYRTVTSRTATAAEEEEEEYEGDYVARAINDTTASTMVEQHDMEVEALRVEQAEVRDLPAEFPVSPARSRGQHESMMAMVAPSVNRSLYAESSVASTLSEQQVVPDTLTETATEAEEEDGYVLLENSRLTENSSTIEQGYSTADRYVDDVSPRRTNRTPMPKIQVDQPTASSISRHSASALHHSTMGTGASPRSAPHRRILTPSTSRAAAGGATMTATLMSPHDESGEALHTSRVSALATQPKLNMHQSQSPATLRSHAYPAAAAASLNSSAQSAETAEVSRSLFIENSTTSDSLVMGSSRPTSKSSSTKRSAQREYLDEGHPYNLVDRDSDIDGGLQPQALFDAARKMKVNSKGVPQLPVGTTVSVSKKKIPSIHRDIFASEPVALEVEKRSASKENRYKKAYAQLQKENQSLKDQLDAALNHKDHWRQVAQAGYSEVLNNTTGISPAH